MLLHFIFIYLFLLFENKSVVLARTGLDLPERYTCLPLSPPRPRPRPRPLCPCPSLPHAGINTTMFELSQRDIATSQNLISSLSPMSLPQKYKAIFLNQEISSVGSPMVSRGKPRRELRLPQAIYVKAGWTLCVCVCGMYVCT